MFNACELNDDQLATCVDEYVQRAMRVAHQVSEDAEREYMVVRVEANCSRLDETYEIKHAVSCGWGSTISIVGNNAIRDGVKAMSRYLNDAATHKPTKVQPMLAAPVVADDAEFEDA